MKAASGRAVWLTDAAGEVPVRVLEGPGDVSVLDGLQAMYEFLSRSKQVREQQPASLSIRERVVVAAIDEDTGAKIYDLTAAIDGYLGGLLPTASAVAIPLTFRSTSPGFITVYPPSIEYDLA